MRGSIPFQFKQFSVQQDRCAMKIGTDGVLLGAWCSIDAEPETILDVGTGTGVIAMQLAQRSMAEVIDAVEIDSNAYEQAVENFENSDWGDRLFCYHSSFVDLVSELVEEEETYDLIVANPPFYTDDYETKDAIRNKARFTSSLSFDSLLSGVRAILSETGIFSVVIPCKEEEKFIQLASNLDLHLVRRCRVRGTSNTEFKRSLLEFSQQKNAVQEESLTIEIDRHLYTEEYMNLVKDFYLNM